LASFSEAIKQMSYYLEDPEDQQGLMAAALDLTRSFGGLLQAARPGTDTDPATMQAAVQNFVQDQGRLIELLRRFILLDPQNQQELLELTQQVLTKVGALAVKASEISNTSSDHQLAQSIIRDAGNMSDAGRTLVSVADILAPVAYDPLSQRELRQATDRVAQSVTGVVGTLHPACDEDTWADVQAMSNDIQGDLGNLGSYIKSLADQNDGTNYGGGDVANHFARITQLVNSVENGMANHNDAAALAAMKQLCIACSNLIKQAKSDAQSSENPDESILRAATNLAGTIRGMLTLISSGHQLTPAEVTPLMRNIQSTLPHLL
jgi:hypothetical protein